MRADDHMMTLLTGGILALTLGVSVQNSTWIMDQFAPKVYSGAKQDAFALRAGIAQNLDVLSNDDFLAGSPLTIVSGPTCGLATVVDDKISYIGSSDCAGDVSFSYCVETDGTCEPAEVALNVRAGSDELMAQAKPATPPQMRTTRIKRIKSVSPTNAQPLERSPAQETRSTPEVVIAAVEEPSGGHDSKPHLPNEQVHALGNLSLLDEASPRLAQMEAFVTPQLLTPDFNQGDLQVDARIDASEPLLSFAAVVDVVALSDANVRTTTQDLGLGKRTDTRMRDDCDVQLSTQVLAGGVVHLAVEAPCYAGRSGYVQHAGLVFELEANEWGMAETIVPAFSLDAELLVSFGAVESGARIVQHVPEMSRMRRVALVWKGDADLGLHAFEFGAKRGSMGHINQRNSRDYQTAVEAAGGYLDHFEVRNGTYADIYTLPAGSASLNGAVSLAVTSQNQTCAQDLSFMTLHSLPGKALTSRSYEISAEACRLMEDAQPDQNLVPEIVLATNTR